MEAEALLPSSLADALICSKSKQASIKVNTSIKEKKRRMENQQPPCDVRVLRYVHQRAIEVIQQNPRKFSENPMRRNQENNICFYCGILGHNKKECIQFIGHSQTFVGNRPPSSVQIIENLLRDMDIEIRPKEIPTQIRVA